MSLRPTLKRSAAHSLAEREAKVLDALKLVREIEAGVPPDDRESITAYVTSASSMGVIIMETPGGPADYMGQCFMEGCPVEEAFAVVWWDGEGRSPVFAVTA